MKEMPISGQCAKCRKPLPECHCNRRTIEEMEAEAKEAVRSMAGFLGHTLAPNGKPWPSQLPQPMKTTRNFYHDRSRCEAAGLEYDLGAVYVTLHRLAGAASQEDVPLLDTISTQFSLQCAAYLESMYERAGVISGGKS